MINILWIPRYCKHQTQHHMLLSEQFPLNSVHWLQCSSSYMATRISNEEYSHSCIGITHNFSILPYRSTALSVDLQFVRGSILDLLIHSGASSLIVELPKRVIQNIEIFGYLKINQRRHRTGGKIENRDVKEYLLRRNREYKS